MTTSPARLRASVFYFFFATGLCFASWASRIPDLKLALGLSDAALGTLLLAAPIGLLLFVPVAGQFVTHFGSRRVLQASGLLIFTGLGLAALLPNIVCATLGLMITGFGVSTVIPVLYSTAGKSGLAFFGFLAAPPLIGYIAEATSMRLSFFVIALLGLSVSLLTAGTSLVRDVDRKQA